MRTTTALARFGILLFPTATLLLGAGGCGPRHAPDQPASVRLVAEVREILAMTEPSPEFYRARSRLEAMGPEVDAVLVALARDQEAKTVTRANAAILLADRRSPAALPVLRRMLLAEDTEALRAAAVLGLQRLTPGSREAADLIREAVDDPARTVRLNALQALDIGDVETIRRVMERETDADVRRVAVQLIALAEARGAPLTADRRGALRTAGAETDPQIVFRPVSSDTLAGTAVGDLRVELPNAPDIPLSAMAEVVGGVVPAFFAPDRSRVVYEVEQEIRVVDLKSRTSRSLGPGTAPRVVPFAQEFVFLRPIGTPLREPGGERRLHYDVYRASFGGGSAERIGEIQAVARPDRHGGRSPVQRMVVGETPEGFVLRGEGLSTFRLPSPRLSPRSGAAPDRSGLRAFGGAR